MSGVDNTQRGGAAVVQNSTTTATGPSARASNADQSESTVQPSSRPLLYRAVRFVTQTLNDVTKSETGGGFNLYSDLATAKKAHALFYHNKTDKVTPSKKKEMTFSEAMANIPMFDRREVNAFAYQLANTDNNLTDEEAKLLMKIYLSTNRSGGFKFPTVETFTEHLQQFGCSNQDLSAYTSAFKKGGEVAGLTGLLKTSLSTPTMIAFGVARGKISEETATALVRVYEGVIVTGKVVLTAIGLAAAITAAIATAITVFGVTIVFAPFVIPAIIGLAIVSATIFAAYVARGVYESKSAAVIENEMLPGSSILQQTADKLQAELMERSLAGKTVEELKAELIKTTKEDQPPQTEASLAGKTVEELRAELISKASTEEKTAAELRTEIRAKAREDQKGLTAASEWVMEIALFLKTVKSTKATA